LLRYLNSFAFAFRFEISSVRHALELLGEDEIRKWVLVCAVTENCIDKPSEVVVWALVRARFCEQLAGE
jgi:c-di-GMP phosphodiesterase